MATFDAIYGVSNGIKRLIESRFPEELGTISASIVQPTDIKGISTDSGSVSQSFTVSLYRVSVSGTQNPQSPRRDEAGKLFRPSRLVDLHYLITPWASSTDRQHQMLGWLINLIGDYGALSSAFLNEATEDAKIFGKLESVQLNYESMPLTDHFNLWDKLRSNGFPASATCVARMVALDSTLPIEEPTIVQTRKFAGYQAEQVI